MEVILREHVDNLGRRGDVVKVAEGYARNYLLPRKLALAVTVGQQAADRAGARGRRGTGRRKSAGAEAVAQRMAQVEIEISRRVGENDTMYGSVTTADIAQALAAKGFEVEKRKIALPDAIKSVGEHTVPVKIHRDVTAQVKIKVVPAQS